MTKSVLPKPRKTSTTRKPAAKSAATTGAADKAAADEVTSPKKIAATKKPATKKAAAKTVAGKLVVGKPTGRKAPARKKTAQPTDGGEIIAAAPDNNETLQLILSRLEDMKAEETVTIDMRGKSAFTDFIVVTSGRSNRHVGAVAENVVKGLKETGKKSVHIEGLTNCDWVLIDTGEVTVHVFRPEVREFYNLERLWAPGPSSVKTA